MQIKSKRTVYVTKKNVIEWCWLIAGILPSDRNFEYYVKHWSVKSRILDAKLSGHYRKTIATACHPRSLGVMVDYRKYLALVN